VLRRIRTAPLQENAVAAAELARRLAADKKFRRQLLRTASHAASAKRRIRGRDGRLTLVRQVATDRRLQGDLVRLVVALRAAGKQVEMKRHHRLRNTLLVVGAGAATAVILPSSRQWLRHQSEDLRIPQETEPQTEAQQAA
jgi:hypothetical protein